MATKEDIALAQQYASAIDDLEKKIKDLKDLQMDTSALESQKKALEGVRQNIDALDKSVNPFPSASLVNINLNSLLTILPSASR